MICRSTDELAVNRLRRINQGRLDSHRRRGRNLIVNRQRRQIDRTRNDLLRRLFRHRDQREKLIVRRRPDDIARARLEIVFGVRGKKKNAVVFVLK